MLTFALAAAFSSAAQASGTPSQVAAKRAQTPVEVVNAKPAFGSLKIRRVFLARDVNGKAGVTEIHPRAMSSSGGCIDDSDQICISPEGLTVLVQESRYLDSVEITASRWTDDWITACRGSDCEAIQYASSGPSDPDSLLGRMREVIVDFFGPGQKSEVACNSTAANLPINSQTAAIRSLVRSTTSGPGSSVESRRAAAIAMWGLSEQYRDVVQELASPGSWFAKYGYLIKGGVDVGVTFADGGIEMYRFVLHGGSQLLTEVPNSFVAGDGISRCPP